MFLSRQSVFPEPSLHPAQPAKRPVALHPLAHIPIAYSILIVSRDPAIRKLCFASCWRNPHTTLTSLRKQREKILRSELHRFEKWTC